MRMEMSGFDWDAGNRDKNLNKHGVTKEETEEIFSSPVVIFDDSKHSISEERKIAFGKTKSGRLLAVVFTMRSHRLRPISVRPMHKKERMLYEKTISKNEE